MDVFFVLITLYKSVPNEEKFKINDNIIKVPPTGQHAPPQDPLQQLLDKNIYPQNYVDSRHPLQGPYNNSFMYPNIYPTVVKRYNISINNPNGDYVKLHNLYEDILPQVKGITQKTLISIEERLIIHQYLRSIFIRYNDGEDIILDGHNGPVGKSELTNLLTHLKVMEINPYHFSKITNNPYSTLAEGFILFRSCYPIRMNIQYNSIQCAPDNISIHIRVYQMKVFDVLVDKQLDINKQSSNLWREISYYEYIKEKIIKKKVCPNFVMMYSWYITTKTGIDFIKILKLKKYKTVYHPHSINNDLKFMRKNANLFANFLIRKYNIYNYVPYNKYPNSILIIDDTSNLLNYNVIFDESYLSLIKRNLSTNKCIIMITEAPTQNIFDWATKTYTIENGPIKRMIQSGFHSDEVWRSIIFQLLIIFIVLINNDIAISEFTLENNIYIKDLKNEDANVGFWKYKVNGIDFYIPNYGYIVLFDSKYHDLNDGDRHLNVLNPSSEDFLYKIYAKFLDNPIDDNVKDYNDKLKSMNDNNCNNIFDSDKFKSGFTIYGGIPPTTDVILIIDKIKTKIIDMDFRKDNTNYNKLVTELFVEVCGNFLHNKVGKILKDVDQPSINLAIQADINNIRSGAYVAIQTSNKYKLGLIYSPDNGRTKYIICNDIQTISYFDTINNSSITMQLNNTTNRIFELIWFIDQEFIANYNTAESNVLETYNISI